MTLRSWFRSIAAFGVGGALLMGAALSPTACKKKGSESTAAVASTKPAASGAAASGACTDYAAKLCDQAGTESATCQAVKTTTELMPSAACAAGLKDLDFSKQRITQKGKACDELIQKLCNELGTATDSCKMVTEQTKKFPPERCAVMLGHIPEIVAELRRDSERNQPLSAEKQARVAAGNAPGFGPTDAKVTVVEFSDFQCPYCSKAAVAMKKLKDKYGDKVRFVFRQFPLSFHQNAREAAEASLAAHAQGKFWAFHDRLFENQSALDRASLEKHAGAVGLDLTAFKKALDEKAHAGAVDQDLKLGEEAGVDGTPSLFVNGARAPNPSDYDAVAELVETALKNAPPG